MRKLIWLAPDGNRYRVLITPDESTVQEIVFERMEDGWTASIPIDSGITFLDLLSSDLTGAFGKAKLPICGRIKPRGPGTGIKNFLL